MPVTIAAAIAPSSPPMIASTRKASRLRARSSGGEQVLQARGVGRGSGRLHRAERRADRADALEIGVEGEIVAAGQHRAGRRQQAGLGGDEIAGRDVGRLARRQPHPARREARGNATGVDDPQHEARAGRPEIDLLNETLQRDDADMIEHRRPRPLGAQPHRQKSRAERRDADPGAAHDGKASRQIGQGGGDSQRGGRRP